MLMTEELAHIDPHATPCWRWETAQQLANDPRQITQSDDPLIQEAATYLRTDNELRYPAIHATREIYEADGLERAEIEARILAGQSDAEISKRCVHPPQLIGVYHDLFLWVRPYLRTDWVITKTVGMGRHVGFKDDELRQVWARYALAGGPILIEEVIDSFRRNARSKDPPRLSVYLREDAEIRPELQADVAGVVIPVSRSGYAWHIEFGVTLQEIRAIRDRKHRQLAMQELRSEMVSVGRKALAGEPLGRPSRREPRKASQSKSRPTTPPSQHEPLHPMPTT